MLKRCTLKGLVRCGKCGSFMTPYYGYGKMGKAYFYHTWTKKVRSGTDACAMANMPAKALEREGHRRETDRTWQTGSHSRSADQRSHG